VFPSGYDLKGLETLMATTEKVRSRLNPELRLLGVVLGNVDSNARLDGDIREMLRGKFGVERVFGTVITRSVKHREAPVYGRTIFEHAPGTAAAGQFEDLSREFIAKAGMGEVAEVLQTEGVEELVAEGGAAGV
jgi:chromosome partitioning protein